MNFRCFCRLSKSLTWRSSARCLWFPSATSFHGCSRSKTNLFYGAKCRNDYEWFIACCNHFFFFVFCDSRIYLHLEMHVFTHSLKVAQTITSYTVLERQRIRREYKVYSCDSFTVFWPWMLQWLNIKMGSFWYKPRHNISTNLFRGPLQSSI